MKITSLYCSIMVLILGAASAQARNLPPPNVCDSATPGLLQWEAQYRFDQCHTGFNLYEYLLSPGNVGTLVPAWHYTTGGPIFFASPTVSNGIVYTGSDDQHLYAVNATTGALIWKYATGGQIH